MSLRQNYENFFLILTHKTVVFSSVTVNKIIYNTISNLVKIHHFFEKNVTVLAVPLIVSV